MIEPDRFHVSDESALDNVYMDTVSAVDDSRAADEHRSLAQSISNCGVPVIRFPGKTATPDDVFPNNVFATAPGRLIVGSMLHSQRRKEAERQDIRELFTGLMNYQCVSTVWLGSRINRGHDY